MIKRRNGRKASLLSATIVGLTLAVGVPTAAQADPYGCRTETFATSGRAICTNGTGTYRVIVGCHRNPGGDFLSFGPAVGIGTWSSASCSGYQALWSDVQIMSF
jgi:hypothetical protein